MNSTKNYSVSQVEFWERLYQAKTLPWDLGKPAPPLETFLKSPYTVAPGSIAVLGCGTGHDCMLFARHGFQVTGIDFSPTAIQLTYKKFLDAGIAGTTGFLLERDVFKLHEYDEYFDYALDHSFFNSIEPSLRRTYARTIKALLKPGGKLIGLWWLQASNGGPPYSVDKSELFPLFEEFFTVDPVVFVPNNSVPMRKGRELFTLMTRK